MRRDQTRDYSKPVDEVAVKDDHHVIEEVHAEGAKGSIGFRVGRCAAYCACQRLVRGKLLVNRCLAVIKLFSTVGLAPEHGIISFVIGGLDKD